VSGRRGTAQQNEACLFAAEATALLWLIADGHRRKTNNDRFGIIGYGVHNQQ